MTHEGTRREALRVRDGWRDSYLFGILEREWQQLGSTVAADDVSVS
jgi:RimJ/RimL family protein N-acetyltransferase